MKNLPLSQKEKKEKEKKTEPLCIIQAMSCNYDLLTLSFVFQKFCNYSSQLTTECTQFYFFLISFFIKLERRRERCVIEARTLGHWFIDRMFNH